MELRNGPVLSVIKSIKIDSEDKLDHAISLVMNQALESPWLGDSSLTEVFRECKKISISVLTKLSNGTHFTFEEIVQKNVCDEFEKLANLKQRTADIAELYKGPVKQKEKWIGLRFEELFPYQKHLICRRVQFCCYLFHQLMISCECMISIMEFLMSIHSNNLQKFSLKCLLELVQALVRGNSSNSELPKSCSALPDSVADNFFARPSVYCRLLDIVDRLRSSYMGNTKKVAGRLGIRNIIRDIKLELEEDELAKVRLEAKKQNELRLMEEKINQLRLESEKKRVEILSQGPLRSVVELQEKDFDSAMIVDLFN